MSSRSSKSLTKRRKDSVPDEDYTPLEKKSRKGKAEKSEGLTLSISRTGRVRKRSYKSQQLEEEEEEEEIPSEEEEDEESAEEELMQYTSHSVHRESSDTPRGRVRKKSAKVIEMEEFEEMEKKTTKKLENPKSIKILPVLPQAPTSSKKSKSRTEAETVTMEMPQKGGGSVIKLLLGSQEGEGKKSISAVPLADIKVKSSKRSRSKKGETPLSPVASPIHQPGGEHELKLKFHLGASPSVEQVDAGGMMGTSEEKRLSPTKIKIKKERLSPMSPLHVQVPTEVDPSMMVKEHDNLKMKLILSPKESPQVQSQFEVAEVHQSKRKKDREETYISPVRSPPGEVLMSPGKQAEYMEATGDKSKKKKKKKDSDKQKSSPMAAATSPQLLAALAQAPLHVPQQSTLGTGEAVSKQKKPKKEKSAKTKLKVEHPPNQMVNAAGLGAAPLILTISQLSFGQTAFTDGSQGELASQQAMPPMYADTKQMALKVQTSAEKKASKGKKGKKGKGKEDPEKPRKRRAPTAYMLWCNSYRSKVVAQNPGIDFATISKRLGEIWQAQPEKEKMSWKRKAKKAAAKGSTLISTGKSEGKKLKSGSGSTQSHAAKTQESSIPSTGTTALSKSASKSSTKGATEGTVASPTKVTGCNPVDIAAHLALLGESLSIIGARLQEHRGHIAVQGTMSVLLDSLLCALGPLTALTTHVLNGCPMHKHVKTLDNIAYIMPGL